MTSLYALLLFGCIQERPPNVLVVLLDDVGTNAVSGYHAHDDPALTPVIDDLAARGMRFTNAYAQPYCSPTRASLMTGLYSDRFGLGTYLGNKSPVELPVDAPNLPRVLDQARPRWSASAVGKWHMTTHHLTGGSHPLQVGFDYHAGSLYNLDAESRPWRGPTDYTRWEKYINGRPFLTHKYATTDTVDEAIGQLGSMRGPWLLYVAFNASHAPVHVPPEGLYHRDLGPDPTDRDLYLAAVEAMDTEIGRLLQHVPDNTVVFLLGDNGTPIFGRTAPVATDQRKSSINEGGSRVPFIVWKKGIEPGVSDALVHVVDVAPTIYEIAGLAPRDGGRPLELDGQSLMPLLDDPTLPGRDTIYTSVFEPNGFGPYEHDAIALRDDRYKLVREDGQTRLHDLRGHWDDGPDLLEAPLDDRAQAAYDRLSVQLDETLQDVRARP